MGSRMKRISLPTKIFMQVVYLNFLWGTRQTRRWQNTRNHHCLPDNKRRNPFFLPTFRIDDWRIEYSNIDQRVLKYEWNSELLIAELNTRSIDQRFLKCEAFMNTIEIIILVNKSDRKSEFVDRYSIVQTKSSLKNLKLLLV